MFSSNVGNKLAGVFSPPAGSANPVQLSQLANRGATQPAVSIDTALQQILARPGTSLATAGNSTSVSTSVPVPTSPQPSAQSDLDLLEEVISQAEQTIPQALPTAMMQVADEAKAEELISQPGGHSRGGKEAIGATSSDNSSALEAGSNVQFVEYEPNAELSPEVEGYINRVEQNADQAPNEIVIADSSMPMPANHQLPSQPVVVLPITPEIEKEGAAKSPKFSIRWLVEWSRKIIKTFVGKVIYRQALD